MSKIIIDHTQADSGDSYLEIMGEVLNVHSVFPSRDVEVHVNKNHESIEMIRKQINKAHSLIPFVKLVEQAK